MSRFKTLVALAAVFAFALACGGHSVVAATPPSPTPPTVVSSAAPTHPVHLRAHDYRVTWQLELQAGQQFLALSLEPYTPGLQTVTVANLRTIDAEGAATVTVPREGDYKVTALTASPTWTVTLTPLA